MPVGGVPTSRMALWSVILSEPKPTSLLDAASLQGSLKGNQRSLGWHRSAGVRRSNAAPHAYSITIAALLLEALPPLASERGMVENFAHDRVDGVSVKLLVTTVHDFFTSY